MRQTALVLLAALTFSAPALGDYFNGSSGCNTVSKDPAARPKKFQTLPVFWSGSYSQNLGSTVMACAIEARREGVGRKKVRGKMSVEVRDAANQVVFLDRNQSFKTGRDGYARYMKDLGSLPTGGYVFLVDFNPSKGPKVDFMKADCGFSTAAPCSEDAITLCLGNGLVQISSVSTTTTTIPAIPQDNLNGGFDFNGDGTPDVNIHLFDECRLNGQQVVFIEDPSNFLQGEQGGLDIRDLMTGDSWGPDSLEEQLEGRVFRVGCREPWGF